MFLLWSGTDGRSDAPKYDLIHHHDSHASVRLPCKSDLERDDDNGEDYFWGRNQDLVSPPHGGLDEAREIGQRYLGISSRGKAEMASKESCNLATDPG